MSNPRFTSRRTGDETQCVLNEIHETESRMYADLYELEIQKKKDCVVQLLKRYYHGALYVYIDHHTYCLTIHGGNLKIEDRIGNDIPIEPNILDDILICLEEGEIYSDERIVTYAQLRLPPKPVLGKETVELR